MSQLAEKLESLAKALEAGGYNAVPTTLTQGSALQVEDCSPVMTNVTYNEKTIKLQKSLSVKSVKSVFIQFNRRLSYGQFGGSAQIEGAVGQEQTGDYVRVGIPMAFYSELRRTTLVSNMVKTQDGSKPEDLEAEAAALKIAGDIEFDLFRGKADFSNSGVFDGNPNAVPALPNMQGLDLQVRQSDLQTNSQDLMFESFGSGLSVVLNGGGVLTQAMIEDASVRSALNHGSAERLFVDPLVLSAYNKLAYANKERIVLAGSPQTTVGADVSKQWVSGGTVNAEASNFLRGKTKPIRARAIGPAAPTVANAVAPSSTTFVAGQVYVYYITQENELGESAASASTTATIVNNGDKVTLTCTVTGSSKIVNVYRSAAGGTAATAKFIGRVANSPGSLTALFVDLNNRIPGFVTGFLTQDDTMEIAELAPYSRMKMAVADLSEPEAHFRFCCLKVVEPRKNVLIDNLKGDQSF